MYESVILDAVVGKIEGGEGRVSLEQDSKVTCSVTRERIAAERVKTRLGVLKVCHHASD